METYRYRMLVGVVLASLVFCSLLPLKQANLLPLFKRAADLQELELGRFLYAAMESNLEKSQNRLEAINYAVIQAHCDKLVWSNTNLLVPSAYSGGRAPAARKDVKHPIEAIFGRLEDLFVQPGADGTNFVQEIVTNPKARAAHKKVAQDMVKNVKNKLEEMAAACEKPVERVLVVEKQEAHDPYTDPYTEWMSRKPQDENGDEYLLWVSSQP
jgi:hypothetical protein